MAFYGHPRYTKDLDVWIDSSDENAVRLLTALEDFGFGGVGLEESDFTTKSQVIQLGRPPIRVDICTSIDGVDFETAYPRRLEAKVGNVTVPFVGLEDLKANKAASGRLQDLADLEKLKGENRD